MTEDVTFSCEGSPHDVEAVPTHTLTDGADAVMERNAVNPVSWSVERGFNQGEVVSGHSRTLFISGQTAMSEDGKPEHDGDMAAQLALSVDNVEAVLAEAGMSLANLVRLNVYTTDVDLLFRHYGVLAGRLGAAGVAPTTTMLGVTRLAVPGQMVELEGTAVA
jgi:enamine deaminase RidA (YjgF/YER057c/UK114 family)